MPAAGLQQGTGTGPGGVRSPGLHVTLSTVEICAPELVCKPAAPPQQVPLTQQGGAHVDGGDIDQHPRQQAVPPQCRLVLCESPLVVTAASIVAVGLGWRSRWGVQCLA